MELSNMNKNSFPSLQLQKEYRSPQHDVANEFFAPVLACSKIYKRSVGFFSSTSLEIITKGISSLVKNGGKIQIVASPKLSEEDIEAIKTGYDKKSEIIEKRLLGELETKEDNYFANQRLNLLANLIAKDILSIKIAFKDNGSLVGIYHEKLGVFEDFEGNKIAFDGSMNESKTAMCYNYESINVYCGWLSEDKSRVELKIKAFDNIWNNTEENLKVVEFPSVTKKILDKYKTKDLDVNEITAKLENLDKEDRKKVEYKIDRSNMIGDVKLPIASPKLNIPIIPYDVDLYDYQKEAIENWKKNNFCGIFDMATGTGKTLTGLGAITRCSKEHEDNLAVIVIAPYQHLVEQWVEDIERFNIKPIIAYSTSSQKNWKERLKRAIRDKKLRLKDKEFFLLVTTNATFKSNFVQEQINNIDGDILLVIDEAHNAGSGEFKKYLDSKFKYRLALSATLDRHNDEEGTDFLHNYFGKVCIHYDLERAIDEKKLTPYKYFPVLVYLTEEELSEYKHISAEMINHLKKNKSGKMELDTYGQKLAIKRSRIIAGAQNKLDVFKEQILPYKDKTNILVYCGSTTVISDAVKEDYDKSEIGERQIIAITKIMGQEMNMQVSRFTSEEDIETRKVITERFKSEKLQAIIAIKCLDEGVNIPSIKTAFILASTTNPKEYIQRRGRVLRMWPGKEYAEIFDFVTLPRELDSVPNHTEEEVKGDLSLVKNELRRIKEFSSIAMNRMDSFSLIDEIQSTYQITDKDLYGDNNSQEEDFNNGN
ncbi:DEAD/DEAH box helicase family protein [uncultured Treponema sp.]|uniref:DEAD/DEAH box helicase family protein n=1 Tax=uncultured Treponema sp. TaxID=162155 RepID=UPI002591B91F|nr:DEAD/DEAH box helicase family protein [uncultured Treponema sp.]